VNGRGGTIAVDSLSKHYPTPAGLVRAVNGVSLEVEPGASVAVTGPSGCGKSTLLSLIGALEAPTAGRVSIGGREISSLPESQRARLRRDELGLVFQSDNLLPFLTAFENVALKLAMHGGTGGYQRCLEVLGELGLAGEVDKLPDQLSGGQRQRVAVARALVQRPPVILADEPTGSLDAESSAAVMDLLLAAQEQTGATLVVVTHDPGVARRLDRNLRLHDGRLAEGPVRSEQLETRRVGA
jgi:putative ABC transport system ATP-binding protein